MGDLQLYFHLGAYKLGPFRTFPERSVSEVCELPVDWRRLVDKAPGLRWAVRAAPGASRDHRVSELRGNFTGRRSWKPEARDGNGFIGLKWVGNINNG